MVVISPPSSSGLLIDMDKLRKLSWNGVPAELRMQVWQLLMQYMPAVTDTNRRLQTVADKRADYHAYVRQNFVSTDPHNATAPSVDQQLWHQISIDVPRTNPQLKLYQHRRVQQSLERILTCWSVRHPAASYVQGMNDLATPFFTVFLHGQLE